MKINSHMLEYQKITQIVRKYSLEENNEDKKQTSMFPKLLDS